MKIVVSACLLGENCKYNGGNNRSEKVLRFLEGHEVLPVCPECLGGLPTPRTPSEILRHRTEGSAVPEGTLFSDRNQLSDCNTLPDNTVPSDAFTEIVTMRDGTVVDEEYRRGAEIALTQALEFGAELAVLQSRSPSCGAKQIYDGTFRKVLIQGQGIFARRCREAGIALLDLEDVPE